MPANPINPSDPAQNVNKAPTTVQKNKTLNMQSFLKIMAAQMKNQSVSSSSTDTSQYVTEMTLFTAIQSMNKLTTQSTCEYGAALVGDDVVVKKMDPDTGKDTTVSGTVSKAILNQETGDCTIQIGDRIFNLSDVAEVHGLHALNTDPASGGGKEPSTESTSKVAKAAIL
jgi:flagellar hook assembly protein FlgD